MMMMVIVVVVVDVVVMMIVMVVVAEAVVYLIRTKSPVGRIDCGIERSKKRSCVS